MNHISRRARATIQAAAMLSLLIQRNAATQQYEEPKSDSSLSKTVELRFNGISMQAMLRDVSDQFRVSVFADGVPIRDKADIEFHGSLRDALDKIADTFDYSVTVHKSGIVSMMKRFTNPEDRPQMAAAEIRQTAADMLTILPALLYDTAEPPLWARMMRQLARRLPPEMIESMKHGKEFVVSDLPPDARQPLADILQWRAYGVARSSWEQLHRQLDRFDQSMLRARKKGVFTAANTGKSTASFSVIHETRGPNGGLNETELGIFQREVKP